ncbi:hypothetical protein BASA81_010129 [Batrachochytrium salamandrivorans]|nr:hypothetical protein BASA81_010129 [Batrachochytrium salamandrivorans]
MKQRAAGHHHVDLTGALEQGLGVHTTKIGSDSKELAYAMPQSRAKWFAMGILLSLFVLAVMAVSYAELFNDERILRALDLRTAMLKMGDQKMESVRLGMALHQQHAVREGQEEEAMRALNRIQNVLTKRFDDFIAKQSNTHEQLALESFRNELNAFVAGEIVNFQSLSKTIDLEAQATLENLSKLQEQSLRDLLKNVNGVKMEAFEDMLRDVFSAGERALEVDISQQETELLEQLVDGLYEEKLTLEDGRRELARIRRDRQWPLEAFEHAVSEVDFAQALEQLVDDGKLSKGKKEVALIAAQWEAAVDQARANQQGGNQDEEDEENKQEEDEEGGQDDEDFDEEIKANVDALLAIHKLVAQGKVPFHLLDFEAIDMKDLQYTDDGGEEGEGENEEEVSEDKSRTLAQVEDVALEAAQSPVAPLPEEGKKLEDKHDDVGENEGSTH